MVETNEQSANDEFDRIKRMIGIMIPDNERQVVDYMRSNPDMILELARSLADEFPEPLQVAVILGGLLEIMARE